MIIGGLAYYKLLRDNYRPRGSKWVKMSKEEAKACDNDLNISMIFALDMDDDYSDDIDKFEYNEDGHTIFLSRTSLTHCHLHFHFGHVDILSKQFITYTKWIPLASREVIMSTVDGSMSISRCSHFTHSWDINTTHF